jgi:hypothetical protein
MTPARLITFNQLCAHCHYNIDECCKWQGFQRADHASCHLWAKLQPAPSNADNTNFLMNVINQLNKMEKHEDNTQVPA